MERREGICSRTVVGPGVWRQAGFCDGLELVQVLDGVKMGCGRRHRWLRDLRVPFALLRSRTEFCIPGDRSNGSEMVFCPALGVCSCFATCWGLYNTDREEAALMSPLDAWPQKRLSHPFPHKAEWHLRRRGVRRGIWSRRRHGC